MKLSVVTTVYYSSDYIEEFYQRISCEVRKITTDYEIIVVDDGSLDDSLSKLLSLKQQDDRLKIIELSRNFGHHQAGLTGLKYCQGDYIFLIDSDLEEPPELIHPFWEALNANTGLYSVYGVQKLRGGSLFQKLSGSLFYKVFNLFSEIKIPPNMMTIRLMKREYVDALLKYPERVLFLGGLMAHVGYRQRALEIDKTYKGSTSYSLHKKLMLLMNSIVSFSFKPIYIVFLSGIILFLLTSLSMLGIGLLNSGFVLTFAMVFLLALWVCSVFLSVSGLLGLYLAIIFQEVKQRPLTIIKKNHQ